MVFTARSGKAVIALSVDGAASSRKEIDGVGESLKRVNDSTFQKLSGQVGAIQSHLGGLKSTVTDLAQLTIAGFGAGAFIGMIKGSIDAADNLNDLSKTTGITLANLAGLKLAAQQSGGDLEGIADSINKLSVSMGKDAERFVQLGVTAKDPLEAFEQLADVFAAIDDPQTRAALGAATLGKNWASAAPLLSEGGSRIRDMVSKGTMLAGTTQEMADRADEFNDTMAEMGAAIDGAKMKLANEMAPALTEVTKAIMGAYQESGKLHAIWVGMGALGSFLFTDEFSSAKVKIENLRGELSQLEQDLSLSKNSPAFGFVGRALWGESTASLEADVARVKGQIESLKKSMEPPAEALTDAFGDRFLSAVAGYKARSIIDGDADEKKREAAAKAAAAAALRQQEAYAALTNSIKGRVAETDREVAGLAPLNEAEKLRIDLAERLISGKLKLSPVQRALYEQGVAELDTNLKLIESQKVSARVYEATTKLLGERQKLAAKSIDDAVEEAEKNEQLTRTFGLTTGAIAELEVARLEGQLAQRSSLALTVDEIETLEKLISAKKRSATALGFVDAQEVAKQANKVMLDEWKTSVDKYDDVFRTGFADMLNNGKDGWESFTKSLVTTFKTSVADQIYKMFAQPFVMKLVAGLIGVTGGAGVASAAGTAATVAQGGNLLSTASNAYGLVTGGMTLAGGLGTGVLGSISGGLMGAGAGAGFTSAAGLAIGEGIAGVVGPSVAASISTGMGAVAAAMPWLAAAAIGGVLLKKAFGHGDKEVTSTTLNGTFGADGFSGTRDSEWRKKGGWLRSDKTGVDSPAIDATMAKQFTAGYDSLKAASADFASVLGINADAIKTRTQSLSIALTTDEAKNKEAISSFFVGVGDTIARELLPTLSDFAKEGEGASATLQRLATNYATIDAALTAVGLSFDSMGVGSLGMRENLVASFGGIDALTAGFAGFGQNYLTEQERLAPVLKAVTGQMEALGYASVDTNAEFKELVLSLNPADAGDAKLLASLLKIQGAFALAHPAVQAVTGAIEDQTAAMREAAATTASGLLGNVDAAYSVMQRVAQGSIEVLNKRIAKERALSEAIRNTLSGMSLQGADLTSRARAQVDIRAALTAAKSGSLPDADSIAKALSVLSQDASSNFSSYEEYARDFYRTQNDIAELGTLADNALSVDEKSLLAIEDMLLGMQTEIDLLKGIDTNGLTLIQAVDGVRAAILAAQQNELVRSAAAINGAYKSALGRAPDPGGMQYFQDRVADGASIGAVVDAIKNSPEAKAQALYQSLLGRQGDAAGVAYWTKAIGSGMSEQSARDLMMQSDEYKKKLRGFAVGTNYLPATMPILAHEGERIIPAADNRALMSRLANPVANADTLVNEVRLLRQQVERLTSAAQKTAEATGEIASSSSQLAEQFDNVTEGGNSMRSELIGMLP